MNVTCGPRKRKGRWSQLVMKSSTYLDFPIQGLLLPLSPLPSLPPERDNWSTVISPQPLVKWLGWYWIYGWYSNFPPLLVSLCFPVPPPPLVFFISCSQGGSLGHPRSHKLAHKLCSQKKSEVLYINSGETINFPGQGIKMQKGNPATSFALSLGLLLFLLLLLSLFYASSVLRLRI